MSVLVGYPLHHNIPYFMHSIRIPPALRTGTRLTILLAQNVRSNIMAGTTTRRPAGRPAAPVAPAPVAPATQLNVSAKSITLEPLSDEIGAPSKFWLGGWCFVTSSNDTEEIAAAINNGEHYKSFTIDSNGEKVYKNSFRVLWDGGSQDLSILQASGEMKSNRLQLSQAATMSDEELADYYAEV